jgi:uncharacterized protein (TIGR02145 family)
MINTIQKKTIFITFILYIFIIDCRAQKIYDIDGNIYTTVSIGNQVWMNKDLNVSHFRNGDSIPEVINIRDWQDAWLKGKPAWCYPENISLLGRNSGKLYNWYAIIDSRGLAPKGFRIPSRTDWITLISNVGNDGFLSQKFIGSGFEMSRIGYRDVLTGFSSSYDSASWWSADLYDENNAWSILMGEKWGPKLLPQGGILGNGIAVRCIKLN